MTTYSCPRCRKPVKTDRPTFCTTCQSALQAFSDARQPLIQERARIAAERQAEADRHLDEAIASYHRANRQAR